MIHFRLDLIFLYVIIVISYSSSSSAIELFGMAIDVFVHVLLARCCYCWCNKNAVFMNIIKLIEIYDSLSLYFSSIFYVAYLFCLIFSFKYAMLKCDYKISSFQTFTLMTVLFISDIVHNTTSIESNFKIKLIFNLQ